MSYLLFNPKLHACDPEDRLEGRSTSLLLLPMWLHRINILSLLFALTCLYNWYIRDKRPRLVWWGYQTQDFGPKHSSITRKNPVILKWCWVEFTLIGASSLESNVFSGNLVLLCQNYGSGEKQHRLPGIRYLMVDTFRSNFSNIDVYIHICLYMRI